MRDLSTGALSCIVLKPQGLPPTSRPSYDLALSAVFCNNFNSKLNFVIKIVKFVKTKITCNKLICTTRAQSSNRFVLLEASRRLQKVSILQFYILQEADRCNLLYRVIILIIQSRTVHSYTIRHSTVTTPFPFLQLFIQA